MCTLSPFLPVWAYGFHSELELLLEVFGFPLKVLPESQDLLVLPQLEQPQKLLLTDLLLLQLN